MAETILNWEPVAIAVLGGVIPSLVWLWFWLKQDKHYPEPTGLIALSFFAGMAIVYFVLPLQKLVVASIAPIMNVADLLAQKFSLIPASEQTIKITLWAFIEEFAKYTTVFLIAFKSKHFDEPIDAVVYLITAALGFAAMENTLYILKDIMNGGGMTIFFDSNLRFVGATTLHIVSAAILGIAFAFAFYARFWIQFIAGVVGILLATLLHAYFNLSIMNTYGTLNTITVFAPFWGAIIGIIILIQVVKHIKNPNEKTIL